VAGGGREALAGAAAAAREAGALMRGALRQAKRVNSETRHDIKLELDVRCQRLLERRLGRVRPAAVEAAFFDDPDKT